MLWVWLALAAPAISSVVAFIDKYVVEHKVSDHRGMPIYAAIVATLFGTTMWLATGRPALSGYNTLLVLASGIFSIWGYSFYFKALSTNHTSFILALLQTTPIFTLVFAYVLLGERLSPPQLLGFALVLGAVIALAVERTGEKYEINSAFWFILIANVFFALANIAIKFTVGLAGFTPVLVYESWGIMLGGLMLFGCLGSVRRAFWESFRSVGPRVLGIVFLNEGIFIISKALTFYAILLGPVALVALLASTQVFYGIVYGVVLSLMLPRVFHEPTVLRHVGKKFVLAAILFGGIYLLI
jgi:drug/metabolite transporter (DMT)-like permease